MRPTPLRRFAAGAVVAAITALTAACGASAPSRDELKTKLKAESSFSGASDKVVDCVAGVLLKYGKAGDLRDYVNGKKNLDAVRGPADKVDDVTKEATACAVNASK
ncbi:MAG TPA: hypothetical protein VLJ59_01025 [Mycobacteriales bacterium]|nr:hypothetical protein [Mycobacteriales bacterium]